MRIGSLFSGIGGLELGLESATGGRVLWQVERDAFCRSVLAKHWPDATRFDDVCTVGAGLAPVDLICGGFPCQPASVAGKRKGMADDRWLWPEFARVVRVVGPRFVMLENVAGLLSLDGGRAWGSVLGDLAALGFDAAWDVFRASDVGAPHRRERLFCLAYASGGNAERWRIAGNVAREGGDAQGEASQRQWGGDAVSGGRQTGALAHRDGLRLPQPQGRERDERRWAGDGCGSMGHADAGGRRGRTGAQRAGWSAEPADADRVEHADGERGQERDGASIADATENGWRAGRGGRKRSSATEPRMGRDADGLSARLDGHRWPAGRGEAQHAEEPPRTAHGDAQRSARLKALGNAVVHQVAALAWRVLSERIGALAEDA